MKERKRDIILSIITPNYKRDCKDLIKHLSSQLLKDNCEIEWIVVYDGPEGLNKECYEKLRIFDNVTQIINEENRGPLYSRYTGLKHAKGKYVIFIDSDDYMTGFTKIIKTLKEMKNKSFIGYSKWIDESGREFDSNKCNSDWIKSPGLTGYIYPRKIIKKCLDYKNIANRYFAEEIPTAYKLSKLKNIEYIDMSNIYKLIADDDPNREYSLYMSVAKNEELLNKVLKDFEQYKKKYPEFYEYHYNFINDYMRNHYKKEK